MTASNSKSVCVWDCATWTYQFKLWGHELATCSVAFFLDGKQIVSGSRDRIVMWDTVTRDCRIIAENEKGGEFRLTKVSVNPSGTKVAAKFRSKTGGGNVLRVFAADQSVVAGGDVLYEAEASAFCYSQFASVVLM